MNQHACLRVPVRFCYREHVPLCLDLRSDGNKQETERTPAGRRAHGERGARQTSRVSAVTLRPSYSSPPCSTECVLCARDFELQQGVCCMERRCQDGHRGRKSEFREKQFPALLPWGPEQNCGAMKRSITQGQVRGLPPQPPRAEREQTHDRM